MDSVTADIGILGLKRDPAEADIGIFGLDGILGEGSTMG